MKRTIATAAASLMAINLLAQTGNQAPYLYPGPTTPSVNVYDGYWDNHASTLEEGAMCRRKSIPITTFMVTDDPPLVEFVEELTKTNRGRAYYTALGKLGQFLLVDYIRNRKRSVR